MVQTTMVLIVVLAMKSITFVMFDTVVSFQVVVHYNPCFSYEKKKLRNLAISKSKLCVWDVTFRVRFFACSTES